MEDTRTIRRGERLRSWEQLQITTPFAAINTLAGWTETELQRCRYFEVAAPARLEALARFVAWESQQRTKFVARVRRRGKR